MMSNNDAIGQRILKFIESFSDGVISTVNAENMPEAATVGFSETPDLRLTFGTYKTSRKYANLQLNPRVAVVFGFTGDVTVQYQGVARELVGDELEDRLRIHFAKIPGVAEYRDNPDQTYFVIEPKWIRYTDYNMDPNVEELGQFV